MIETTEPKWFSFQKSCELNQSKNVCTEGSTFAKNKQKWRWIVFKVSWMKAKQFPQSENKNMSVKRTINLLKKMTKIYKPISLKNILQRLDHKGKGRRKQMLFGLNSAQTIQASGQYRWDSRLIICHCILHILIWVYFNMTSVTVNVWPYLLETFSQVTLVLRVAELLDVFPQQVLKTEYSSA